MAYSSWSVIFGEQPSAAKWNILGTNDAGFNDGTAFAWRLYRARAYRSAVQSVNSGVITKIQFNAESYDPNSNFDSTTNFRYVAPVNGYYLVSLQVAIESTIANQRVIAYIRKNGSDYAVNPNSSGIATTNGSFVSDVVQLSAAEYVEGFVYQDAGTNKDAAGSSAETFISVHFLSAA